MCAERRTDHLLEARSAQLTACAVSASVIEHCSAAMIQIRVPRALQGTAHIAVELLASALDNLRVAPLSSVCAPVDDLYNIAIANPSNQRIDIRPNIPIATVFPVEFSEKISRRLPLIYVSLEKRNFIKFCVNFNSTTSQTRRLTSDRSFHS